MLYLIFRFMHTANSFVFVFFRHRVPFRADFPLAQAQEEAASRGRAGNIVLDNSNKRIRARPLTLTRSPFEGGWVHVARPPKDTNSKFLLLRVSPGCARNEQKKDGNNWTKFLLPYKSFYHRGKGCFFKVI